MRDRKDKVVNYEEIKYKNIFKIPPNFNIVMKRI